MTYDFTSLNNESKNGNFGVKTPHFRVFITY